MAVDQHRNAETGTGFFQQRRQRLVIGLVQLGQPCGGFGAVQLAAIDLGPVAHNARDHAQPGHHPRGGRIHRHVQGAVEHAGIQLALAAVDVQEGAGELRRQQRRPQPQRAGEQFVDKGVFGPAQGGGIQPGAGQQALRIAAPGMGRGEHERHGLSHRAIQAKGAGFLRVHDGSEA